MIAAAEQAYHAPETSTALAQEASSASPESQAAQSTLTWQVFPAAKSPTKLVVIWLSLLATLILGILVTHSLAIALLGALLLLASIKDFALPLRYELSEKSAKVSCFGIPCSEIDWTDVKSVYVIPGGLKLSPSENPGTSNVEHIRGVALRWDTKNRHALEQSVQVFSGNPIQTLTLRPGT